MPRFSDDFGVIFDLVFIDGGHDYATAMADLRNMRSLVVPGTFVVMDDLTPWKPWGVGPTTAWREACATGLVQQVILLQDGIVVDEAYPVSMTSRVWALGTYGQE